MWARTFVLSVAIVLFAACTDSGPTGSDAGGLDGTVSQYGDWNGALADTTPAPPVALPQTVLTASNNDNWICNNTQLDLKRNLDALMAPGATAGVLWPGALIQGQTLIDGAPAEIPLPRSPITISIDLGVDSASARIDDPTSASVQAAIATLQRRADARLGPIDVVPARVRFHQKEAFGSVQLHLGLGFSASGSAPLEALDIPLPGKASLGTDKEGGVTVSFQKHVIGVSLIQPMYTISFADEEKPTPSAYLAPSVTNADVQDMIDRGMISSTNLPLYVKSVTYGRIVVFTMTNTTTAQTADLERATQAALNLFKLGSVQGSSNLTAEDSLLLRTSELHIVAFGGSQDSALAAIRSGDLGKFFTAVPATQAVPLSYNIKYLKNGRTALLGGEAKYVASDCAPAGSSARYWHITLDSVTSNGGCDSASYWEESAFIVDYNGTVLGRPLQRILYVLLGHVASPMVDTAVKKEITVLLPTSGPEPPDPNAIVAISLYSWFYPGTALDTGECAGVPFPPSTNLPTRNICSVKKDFVPNQQFAVNPMRYTHILTLPDPDEACTVTFSYEVSLEPALAPPVPGASSAEPVSSLPRETGASLARGLGSLPSVPAPPSGSASSVAIMRR